MKHHVHIYKLAGKVEYDIEADSPSEARGKAIEKMKKLEKVEWEDPEREAMAVTYNEEEEE